MNILKSKAGAWGALILVVAVIIMTFPARKEWWAFIDVFCAFMMVFCHLMALYLGRLIGPAGKKLEIAAIVFGVLMIVSFIVEFIVMQCMM